ncbi:hypothetical protein NBO_28g0077 [Nosema bombycis CQ1]|uniref:Uncharacterized protein n=1 Tax=Nosema bombycis (strain CQ1 / CVCC 102059) TaxID=578461 RepID=R0MNL0_NOSB1|nr:hypothetical protein NBO_28g0077 [Nosema bombycis CQ1]|eukprot:EOB14438.1 hypothetical protein NBO_28g0077 [Nosema bombycis CQ1]
MIMKLCRCNYVLVVCCKVIMMACSKVMMVCKSIVVLIFYVFMHIKFLNTFLA